VACKPASENSSEPSVKKEAWVTDEVLVQLQEIKTDLAEVKKQQEEMKALLEKGAVRAGAPAAKAVGSVSLKGTPAPSAKVAVVEFTDYQCPFCARHAKNVLPQIRDNFVSKGTVFYEVRNFPLDFHAEARGAGCEGEDLHRLPG
jgi:protein-disulfide isomerase